MRTMQRLEQERRPLRKGPSKGFLLSLFLLALLVATYLFLTSTYFAVGSVIIEGTKYMAEEDVYRAAGIPERLNIFRLDTADIKRRLLHDLRVAEADVTRQFPATVVIRITERKPLAYTACSYGFVQMDKQGVVVASLKTIKQFNVPIITGVRLGNSYVGDTVDNPQIKKVLEYLAALDEGTLNQLSEINIKSTGELTAYTIHPIMIRLGAQERLEEKAKLTTDILHDISDRKSTIEYIDLNYASPYIKFKN